jgi:hypothetical protein
MRVQSALCLTAHPSPLKDLRPPVDRLLKHITVDDPPGNHWFWNDNRRNHRHNSRGHALFTWKVAPTRRTRYGTRGEYCVVRVLLEHRWGVIPPRTQIENVCRLPQCVNPDHWRVHRAPPPWRVEIHEDATWQLVDYRTGIASQEYVVVRVYDGTVVHVVNTSPQYKRLGDTSMRALCGHNITPVVARLVDAPVTCTGGC